MHENTDQSNNLFRKSKLRQKANPLYNFIFHISVELGNRERLIAFCEVVQQTCPVGSFIKPTAGENETPGYASQVCVYLPS
jgi:cystathionine beta-lyase family protein involved in aluminum resistance